MQVHRGRPPGSGRLARTGVELSREARVRLHWMDFYRRSRNVAGTCRHFGISRQTFYRWRRRYDPYDLTTLEARSHRPHRQRQPTWSFPLEEKVLTLRLQFPRWGKDKLAILLRRQHLPVSTSMGGRILTRCKQHGRLMEPPRPGVAGDRVALCGSVPMPCATQAVRRVSARRPGPGRYPGRAASARRGLQTVHRPRRGLALGRDSSPHSRYCPNRRPVPRPWQQRMPFPIRALQVDGGSECAAQFELACQQRGLHLFVLPPRSPNSMALSNAPTAPTPRSSTRSPLAPWG